MTNVYSVLAAGPDANEPHVQVPPEQAQSRKTVSGTELGSGLLVSKRMYTEFPAGDPEEGIVLKSPAYHVMFDVIPVEPVRILK